MYAIYLRKSRKDRELEQLGDAETLARHEHTLSELAKKKGLAVSDIYREVVSGETITARPEMQKLLGAVERGAYKGVLVMEIERLARGNTKDQGIVAEAFQFSDTLIITPSRTYDPSDESDQEYFEFGLFMSRREYKTINRRIQRGRIASVKEGKYIAAAPPFGYDKVKIKGAKGYTLAPNKDAETVKLIYSLYTDSNTGMLMIARKLDSLGIKPSVSEHWSRSSVKDILTNPTYTGKIRWQWRKVRKTMENGRIVEHRQKSKTDEYMLVEGLHPGIISEEIFNRAQKILKDKYIPPVASDKNIKNPLAGLITCEKCGATMTKAGEFLKCPNRNCSNISSGIELVEKAIMEILEDWLADYTISYKNKEQKSDFNNYLAIIKSCSNRLETLKRQLTNTYELLEQGVYTTDVFKKRREAIQKDIDFADKQLKQSKTEYQKLLDEFNSFIPHAKKLIDAYYSLDNPKAKNNILHELLAGVTYIKTERGTRNKPAPFALKIYPRISKSRF